MSVEVKMSYFQAAFELLYVGPSVITFFIGVASANNPFNNACYDKWSKIEYIYPAFRVGCYLNEKPE